MDEYARDDDAATVRKLRSLAEQGDTEAQLELGHRYAIGSGVLPDDEEAVFWFREAAEQGEAKAQLELGHRYAIGWGFQRNDEEAVLWYRKAAEQGEVDAQLELGERHTTGRGVPRDDEEAVFWFRKAAERGEADAQVKLGTRYEFGWGVPEDAERAVFWYREAAKQGHADAQCRLGLKCAVGKGVSNGQREAVFWFRKAAEQGHAQAQCCLGDSYFFGDHVPADGQEAAFWYREAAQQGHADAQCCLGDMYAKGEHVSADSQEAVLWYSKAAEQGNAYAQFRFGLSYANGEGVPEDDVFAYVWLNLAAAQGDETAQQYRNRIRHRMTSAQVEEAQKLSREIAAKIADDGDKTIPATTSRDPIGGAQDGLFDNRVRARGQTYDVVRQAQSCLALLGYDTGSADGLPGERTTAAVQRFQQDQGVTPTGQISEELLALLKAMASAQENRPAELVSSGSGFVVSRDGWIVTNHHVVEGRATVTVNCADTSHAATVWAAEPSTDLALLKVPVKVGDVATFSESPRASLGEAATVAGYPLHGIVSKGLNVTTGNVSALAGPGDDAKLLQVTAPVQQGNSGGPLLDGTGNVIGVVVATLNAVGAANLTGYIPQNVNFAIKGALVRAFLDIHGVAYERRPSSAKLTPEQLAELAHTFTVAVHCRE